VAGAYPDGIAFALLLANAATPWLNQWGARLDARFDHKITDKVEPQ